MTTSLRARLFVGLALFILATSLIAGSVAYRWAFDEAIELQDAILLQVSSLVANNRLQTGLPAEGHVDAEARVSIEELGQATTAAQTGNAAPHLPPTLPEGLQTIARGQETWRVLVRTRSDGSRVAVGHPPAGRNEIANGSALRTVLPLAALVPCLMLLVGIEVIWKKAGSRPLTGLEYFESFGWDAMKQILPSGSLETNAFQSLNVPMLVADWAAAPAVSPTISAAAMPGILSFIVPHQPSSPGQPVSMQAFVKLRRCQLLFC